MRPIESVLQALTRSAGITVIAESSLAGSDATYPSTAATPENLESLLDQVVKSLPAGTVWKKALLPTSTRFYKGDDVAEFLEVQARMLGRSVPTEATVPVSVEILGQKLSPEKAAPVVSTLGLKPVYVLVNPNRRSRTGDPLSGNQGDFSQLLNNFVNMDPNARMRLMQQFGQMLQNMPPDQRRQIFSGFGPPAPPSGGGIIR